MSDTETPAPLDAYLTAKSNEPVFVLQGGDPLAAPLVRLWAAAARVRAGAVPPSALTGVEVDLKYICADSLVTNEREAAGLLTRATAAEEVSWSMDDYRKGRIGTEEAKPSGENSADEKARLDVYDLRRRCADRISNLRCSIAEYRDDLIAKGYITSGDELDNSIEGLMRSAKTISDRIDVRRGNASD